jgi:phage gp29-like protein
MEWLLKKNCISTAGKFSILKIDCVLTFSQQAIHHGFNQLQLVLDGKVDKIGINQNMVWRTQSSIVFEKEGRSNLRTG